MDFVSSSFANTTTPVTGSAVDLALGTGPIVQAVLFCLIAASFFSWAIIFAKWNTFRKARSESKSFLDLFWNSKSLENIFTESRNFSASPVSNVFRTGYIEYQKLATKAHEKAVPNESIAHEGLENVERALKKASTTELLRLEKLIGHLGTIASVAPFVGLFGTVWGIMNSFQGLASGGPATIQRVAPGISEALIATAVGLAAAIPAVVAYNQFAGRLRYVRAEIDGFCTDFTNILRRNYLGS
jgi:biopolymer transport protein TolQ